MADFFSEDRMATNPALAGADTPTPAPSPSQPMAPPPQDNRGMLKQLLSSFFVGGGSAMMKSVGLETPEEQQQRQFSNNLATQRQAALDQQAQSIESLRKAQEQQMLGVEITPEMGAAYPQLRGLVGQRAPKVLLDPITKLGSAQIGAQGKVDAAATTGQFGLQRQELINEGKAANPTPSNRDNRYIDLQGRDPKTWSAADQQFVAGYEKWVDKTKVQPGVQRAMIFTDPARQARSALAKSLAAGSFANQTTSINALLGHLGDLKDNVDSLNNLDEKFLNMPINKIRQNTGDTRIINVLAKIEPVRKEFESLLLNNRALYEADRESADIILNENSAPAQLQTAMKSMAHTAAVRIGAVNSTVKRVTGEDIPELLQPSSGSVLSDFGEDIPDYGGSGTFSNTFPSPQNKKTGGSSGKKKIVVTQEEINKLK